MKEEIKVYDNVLQLIGNTPLIHLNTITKNLKVIFMQKQKPLIQDTLPKIV